MAIRHRPVDEAARRAERQVAVLVADLIAARHAAGLSQSVVGRALGVSRPLVASWERGRIVPSPIQLARWGAVVGLDVSIRAFPGGAPLRDAGQLRVLQRFRDMVGPGWAWRTEVPLGADASDRRAFDALLSRGAVRVGVEVVSRLTDGQGQTRQILLKQQGAGLTCMVLVLPDSKANRVACRASRPTLGPAFPCPSRVAMASLRRGEAPPDNAVVFV
jgi:transcriptional regulator with XRE-family HTH domain